MSWVAVGIIGSAVVGGIASNMAANKQAAGQEQAANTQLQMFNTLQQQQQPFIDQGVTASNELSSLLNPANAGELSSYISSLPGYQFQLETGGKALTSSMTPGSGALSGQTLKSLMNYNQGLAGTYYNNYVNQLMGMMNTGEAGAAALGGVGEGLGTGIAQAQAAAAGSQAAGIVGASNSLSQIPSTLMLSNMMGNGSSGANWGGIPSSTSFTGAPLAGGGS